MWEDPIVAEVRKVRAQIEEECGHDLDAMFKRWREQEARSSAKIVKPEPRRKPREKTDPDDPNWLHPGR